MAVHTIRDLLNREYGVAVVPRFNRELTALVVGAFQLVMRQDPSRIGFAIVNDGSFDVGIAPTGQPPGQKSFIIPANGGTLVGDWKEDGELVSQRWEGFANGGTSTILVVEILIEKPLETST